MGFIFIHNKAKKDEVMGLFTGFDGLFGKEDTIYQITDDSRIEDLVVVVGTFSSQTQARKNNWKGEIPKGYKEWKVGKKRFWSFIPIDDTVPLHDDGTPIYSDQLFFE